MHPPHRRLTWWAGLQVAVVFALTYLVFAEVGLTLRAIYNGDAVFWGASGLTAAVFSYTSPRLRWYLVGGVLFAAAAANLYHGSTLPIAVGFALANAVEGLIAGTWLGQRIPQRRRLVQLADVRTLLIGAILGSGAGAAIGGATIFLSGVGTVADVATWFAANAVGIVTIGPAVLAVASLKRDLIPRGWQRGAASIVLTTVAVLLVAHWLSDLTDRNLTYLVLVPLLMAALWMGQRGTSMLVAAVSVYVIGMASHGNGAFAQTESSLEPVIAALFFMTVVQITVLTMAIEAGRRRDLIAEMRGVLDAAVEAVLVVDETGTIRRANPGAGTMFATTEQNLIGRSLIAHIPEIELLADKPTDQLSLTRGLRVDGSEFWAEISEGGIGEPSGRQRRAVIVRDVTGRIEIENKVKRIQDEFVSNMTHELKTPLTAIIGFSDWLLSNPDSPNAAEDLQIINTSAMSLLELIDNILEFKRLSSAEPEMSIVDLESLVVEVIAMNRTAAAERRITMSFSAQSVSAIVGDRRQMEQAIRNLISNAVKYSKLGGTIEVNLQDSGRSVVLTITDHGIGISDEDQKRLFERFYRASNAGDVSGTGLGLVMARQIAESHGGELRLTSRLGEGTRVEMRLPAVRKIQLSPNLTTADTSQSSTGQHGTPDQDLKEVS